MPDEPQFVQETLDWCNQRRAEKNLEPLDRLPKGKRHDPESCPCGLASGVAVGSHIWGDDKDEFDAMIEGRTEYKYLPEKVQTFTRVFDTGGLPQYDASIPTEGTQ